MKISFVANFDISYVRYRNTILKRLNESDIFVDLICLNDQPIDGFPNDADPKKATISYLGSDPSKKNAFGFLLILFRLITSLRRNQPDLVFAQNTVSIIATGVLKRVGLIRSPFIALVEGVGRGLDNQTKYLWRIALKAADDVIFLNAHDKEALTNSGVDLSGCKVTQIKGVGVDLQSHTFEPIPAPPVCVLMICRLVQLKNPLDYCRAAKLCKKAGSEAKFVLIYEAQTGVDSIPEEALKEFSEDVTLVKGPVDVQPYLRASSFLCLPSKNEGLPVVVMEAAATGRASLVSDHPTLKEAISPESGWMVPLGQPNVLAEKMMEIFEDGSFHTKGVAARDYAEAHFDKEQRDQEFLSVIVQRLKSN